MCLSHLLLEDTLERRKDMLDMTPNYTTHYPARNINNKYLFNISKNTIITAKAHHEGKKFLVLVLSY
jgi:hypothetical protein